MIYGFTGTRKGMSLHQQSHLFILLDDATGFGKVILHHGGCIGADAEAHDIAVKCEVDEIHVHWSTIHGTQMDRPALPLNSPTKISVYKPNPPLFRDHIIVDVCEKLIAAPLGDEITRSGTWATVRYARKIGREVIILNR